MSGDQSTARTELPTKQPSRKQDLGSFPPQSVETNYALAENFDGLLRELNHGRPPARSSLQGIDVGKVSETGIRALIRAIKNCNSIMDKSSDSNLETIKHLKEICAKRLVQEPTLALHSTRPSQSFRIQDYKVERKSDSLVGTLGRKKQRHDITDNILTSERELITDLVIRNLSQNPSDLRSEIDCSEIDASPDDLSSVDSRRFSHIIEHAAGSAVEVNGVISECENRLESRSLLPCDYAQILFASPKEGAWEELRDKVALSLLDNPQVADEILEHIKQEYALNSWEDATFKSIWLCGRTYTSHIAGFGFNDQGHPGLLSASLLLNIAEMNQRVSSKVAQANQDTVLDEAKKEKPTLLPAIQSAIRCSVGENVLKNKESWANLSSDLLRDIKLRARWINARQSAGYNGSSDAVRFSELGANEKAKLASAARSGDAEAKSILYASSKKETADKWMAGAAPYQVRDKKSRYKRRNR